MVSYIAATQARQLAATASASIIKLAAPLSDRAQLRHIEQLAKVADKPLGQLRHDFRQIQYIIPRGLPTRWSLDMAATQAQIASIDHIVRMCQDVCKEIEHALIITGEDNSRGLHIIEKPPMSSLHSQQRLPGDPSVPMHCATQRRDIGRHQPDPRDI
jgi:hypothetical protein